MNKTCKNCDHKQACANWTETWEGPGVTNCHDWSGWHDIIEDTTDMPNEKESVFNKYYGTDKWRQGMFRKRSDDILVCYEFPDGTRTIKSTKTLDGVIFNDITCVEMKPIAWRELPKYEINK